MKKNRLVGFFLRFDGTLPEYIDDKHPYLRASI